MDDHEFEERERQAETEEEESMNRFKKKADEKIKDTLAGRDPGYERSKIDFKKIIINELLESFSNITRDIKRYTNKVIVIREEEFTGAIPDWFEMRFKEYLKEHSIYAEGFVSIDEKYYEVKPIIFTFIDNSGSMAFEIGNTPIIDIFKNAVLNTLCEKEFKVLAVDWDVELKDVIGLNKESSSYKNDVDRFMHFRGQGGTTNFGYFYANLDKIVEKNKDLFDEEVKKIGLENYKELIDKWKSGEVSVIYLTDGELLSFYKEVKDFIEKSEVVRNLRKKDIEPFNFIIPEGNYSNLKRVLGDLPEDLYRIFLINIKDRLERLKT